MHRKNPVTTITIRTDSLLNMTDAINYLHITRRTMFRWIKKKKVQTIKMGGHLFFSTDELKMLNKAINKKGGQYATQKVDKVMDSRNPLRHNN